MEFSNQLHLALYGESWDDRIERERAIEREREIERERTLTVTNLLKLETLSTEQIATIINQSVEFVEKIKAETQKSK